MLKPLRAVPIAVLIAGSAAAAAPPSEPARWRAEAARVTITRDTWGIAHVHGQSDADAVFGGIYAQAEDDFPRIEANYLTALGRTAEADGEGALWADLRQRLWVDPARLRTDYARSPAWLRTLMDAWADGLNYYLATHARVHPRVLTRFEPWMALSFTEGSIGGDIERAELEPLRAFYEHRPARVLAANPDREPRGSNGIAIAPANTKDGHALLLINPHTSFFFRSELQMTSEAGLNVYGAATWGQFFIYQGWNAHAGWMHTTSGADCADEFAETVTRTGERWTYRHGGGERPVRTGAVTLRYRTAAGGMAERTFPTYATHHGPIVREAAGKWIALAIMDRPIAALEQSFLRTRTRDLAGFLKVAALQANSSNNTLFADDRGEIAYLHPQFVPRRDDRFDWTKPVDGSDPAADWHGVHALRDLPSVLNPKSGWAMNTNNAPWGAAGADSPRRADFPRYMDQFGENARGVHATALLSGRRDFTLPGLIAAAYDPAMPAFARLMPSLTAAWDALPAADPRRAALAEPIALLRAWDARWGADSAATSLAVIWAETLGRRSARLGPSEGADTWEPLLDATTARDKLDALTAAVVAMRADYGGWRVPWGRINRFQRNDAAIVQTFDDARPSTPVPFASARWGTLASFGARRYPGTRNSYGTSGNSFVAAVEFGPRVRARAVSAGGESGDPASPHFADQTARYASGDLRPVWFWPDELAAHAERRYRPGE